MPPATQPNLFLSLCLFCLSASPGLAQVDSPESDGDGEQAIVDKWNAIYDSIVDSFQVRQLLPNSPELNPDSSELSRQTILSVNNPLFEMAQGRVYLWTDQGRPIALGSIASAVETEAPETRRIAYEFHSLSQFGVSASRDDRAFWRCEIPGVTWLDAIEEIPPSDNRTVRLSQMKMIARRFTAHGPANEFRLMPTPLYRYPSDMPDVTDGAIFAFAVGTDPCIYLLVEAQSNAWRLAFARSNTKALKIKREEEHFLDFADVSKGYRVPTQPFCLIWRAERRSIADPERVVFQAALPTAE